MTESTPNHHVDARVLVPMKLDAFVLNSAVCSGTDTNQAKIAPITAPNYTYLRLDDTLLRPDVLDHVDLHHTAPAQYNSRFTDLGTGTKRVNREGVYLHWMLPRPYRAGAMTDDQPAQQSSDAGAEADADVSAPSFVDLPTRWLVIRALNKDTVEPELARESVPAITAWVVESDRQWELDELGVDVDLQVDVSPFITGGKGVDLEEQAEVFIGAKTPLADWTGEEDADATVKRAKLSLLHSSNPLFADYQPHNSNVFSMVDTFSYTSTGSDATSSEETKKLTAATASYYVLGWHSAPDKDLFATADKSRAVRLQELNMVLKSTVDAEDWSRSTDGTRLLCHGALYDVKWDVGCKPQTVLADKYANVLNSKTGSSVAVGTTSLDALIAYVAAQRASSTTTSDGDDDDDDDDGSEAKIKELEEIIFAMQSLLHARDDGVDTRLEAADQVNAWNYSRSDGGYVFHPSSSSSTTNANSTNTNDSGDANKIDTLNKMQLQLDATWRAQRQTRWNLFSLWWKCITNNIEDDTKYKEDVKKQSDYLANLQALSSSLLSRIATLARGLDVKKTAADHFYEQRDPTLLLAGIPSGWPYDFQYKLEVRLDYQTVDLAGGDSLPDSWETFITNALLAIPSSLRSAAKSLMTEFVALEQEDDSDGSSGSSIADDTTEIYPLYHDQGWNPTNDENAPWRDSWGDIQPWFPLFVEWEVEYTHIPFDYWSFGEHSARLSQELVIRGGIRDDIVLYEHTDALAKDRRLLSGRTLILPQPVLALQTLVAQILVDTSDSELAQAGISRDQVRELQNSLYQLALISAPLAGFHDHLATRALGNHVKPNNRLSANELKPIVQAVRDDAGLTTEVLQAMLTDTNPTPYGFLVDFSSSDASPFKPAVHGQFKFTKMNIVDKFGQAIHAIDPTPRPQSQGIPPLYPCISDFYEPQVVLNEDGSVHMANTVVEEDRSDQCRYIQVPPHINQAIRFNGALVTLEQSSKNKQKDYYWRPATASDNPVWGWVVANRADNGLQFFRADGSFYCEVRLGGPNGEQQTKWLPFAPDTTTTDSSIGGAATAQFEEFIGKFKSAEYLCTFAETVELALENLPVVPNSYADYLNAAIGKPLALVNMAWSLELAVPEYANQASLTNSSSGAKPESLHDHSWKVKLGDKQRSFDGLVAYFQASDKPDKNKDDDENRPSFDFDTFYTYYYQLDDDQSQTQNTNRDQSPLCPITNTNYPAFEPFWRDPLPYNEDYEQHYVDRCKKLTAFAAVVDPFTPVHAFSSFFPVQTLRLPPWTWQAAMNKMTTFFQMGPLVIPADVPLFQQQYSLQAGYQLAADVPGPTVPIPALKVADWAWLQPYNVPATDGGGADQPGASAAAADSQAYMPLGLSMLVDGRPRLEVGPYTAVEGFLQLKTPILRQLGGDDAN